ncbi:hypothetical protein D4764_07G0005520 [Takifugu flavidus]|uniref:Uncharacterized protein n=1 Tax=Takifugu flavidus TaxID=433684 RepID=A0A5C6MSB4_9TELE|nr:hypothetical protein D4764_07G0005520 [Takifugu flavidus]
MIQSVSGQMLHGQGDAELRQKIAKSTTSLILRPFCNARLELAEVALAQPPLARRGKEKQQREQPPDKHSSRDDLFRVELDNVAGDEMFYSKKRTWESNKNDIRICRMKGKHEVRDPYSCYCGS